MATLSLVAALPSKEAAVSLHKFLANNLEGLLSNNNSLKGLDQETVKKTLLMPVPAPKEVSLPTIQVLQWYQIVETEDEDYIIALEEPLWWPQDIFRSFFYGVLAPAFQYFVDNKVNHDDKEYCFLLQGIRVDDVSGVESHPFPLPKKSTSPP